MNDAEILGALEDDVEGDHNGLEGMDDAELGRRTRRAIRLRRPPAGRVSELSRARATAKRVPIGWPKATFANSEAVGVIKEVEIEPQRDYQGERLIATAVSPVPEAKIGVKQVWVGDQPQIPNLKDPVPLSLFAKDTVGAALELSMCPKGVKLRIEFQVITALGVAEGGDVTAGMLGQVASIE